MTDAVKMAIEARISEHPMPRNDEEQQYVWGLEFALAALEQAGEPAPVKECLTTAADAGVTQGDREAAAAYYEATKSHRTDNHLIKLIRQGDHAHALVQAFAAHRLQSVAAATALMPTIWEDPAGKGYPCFERPMTPAEAKDTIDWYGREIVRLREALAGVRSWAASLTVTDMNEIVADGGITAGMVVGQEAIEQVRRLDAALPEAREAVPSICQTKRNGGEADPVRHRSGADYRGVSCRRCHGAGECGALGDRLILLDSTNRHRTDPRHSRRGEHSRSPRIVTGGEALDATRQGEAGHDAHRQAFHGRFHDTGLRLA